VRVCFIGGVGRSGSTLLELLLARVPGVVTLGETIHLVERGLRNDELCTCGERFSACPFWRAVGDEAFGGWPYDRIDDLARLQHSVDKHRHVPQLLMPVGAFADRLADLTDGFFAPIITAAARLTGASLVVDNSKHPSHEMVLSASPSLDVRTVRLVRRPEGVARSWSKEVRRPEIEDSDVAMPQYSVGRSTVRWVAWNLLLELEAARHPSLLLRYEDLVADPDAAVARVLGLCGGVPADGPVQSPVHGIGGNPVRFREPVPKVVADESWRHEMPVGERRLVAALSSPLRWRYGYTTRHGARLGVSA
jgi:hypothetical protein